MKPKDVLNFIDACMCEAEADGYQQQEDSPIHNCSITWGEEGATGNKMWIMVGNETFILTVTKPREKR